MKVWTLPDLFQFLLWYWMISNVHRSLGDDVSSSPWAYVAYLLAHTLATLGLLWLFRGRRGAKPLWDWGELADRRQWALLVVVVGITWLANGIPRGMLVSETTQLTRAGLFLPLAFVVSRSVVITPVLEEIVFRGILQTSLERRWGLPIAVALSALIFMLFHSPTTWPVPLVYGIVWGYLASRGRTLTFAILAHAIWNLFVAAHAIAVGRTNLSPL